jgi:2-C-methyl-D-erythritol 4-phosphate cytidylyltransferase
VRLSGVASVKLKDSIRKVDTYGNKNVNREDYYIVQTPQTFRISLIKNAFKKATTNQFTDDASVLEASGEKVYLTKGDYQNIKVTTLEDLLIAESFLQKK